MDANLSERTSYPRNNLNQYTGLTTQVEPGTLVPNPLVRTPAQFQPVHDVNGNSLQSQAGLVLDFDEENRLVRSTYQGAGGIGGLLSLTRNPLQADRSSACYFSDGNGHITRLFAPDNSLLASYSYSPFGETLERSGPWAGVNAFRFSSKEQGELDGIYYYGLRYYNPIAGRFINRDPIEEGGGANLYGMVANDPLDRRDVVGLAP